VQAYYSLVSRNAEREIMPMTQAHGLALTVWSPLAGGFLTGKIDRGTPSAPGRRQQEQTSRPSTARRPTT
jgi:aryl-alcohol dehydrogenase-like predicted oxidoreductase